MTRYQQLQQRREKLIELNIKNRYTVIGNPKIKKYFDLLLQINKESIKLQMQNDTKFDKSNNKFTAI